MADQRSVFFVDVDGTLIGGDFVLGDRVVQSARAYQRSGGKLVLCTGRSVIGSRHIARKIGGLSEAVLFNGAAVYDFKKEKFLWKKPLEKRILSYVSEIYEAFPGVCIQIYTENEIFQLRTNWMVENKGVPEERGRIYSRIPEISDDILKVSLIANDIADLKGCEQYLAEERYSFEFSGRHFVELIQRGAGKDVAAKACLAMMGAAGYKVYAAGNGKNDRKLLKMSHMSFVPENAQEEVKRYGNRIIKNPEEGGIADAFEKAAEF